MKPGYCFKTPSGRNAILVIGSEGFSGYTVKVLRLQPDAKYNRKMITSYSRQTARGHWTEPMEAQEFVQMYKELAIEELELVMELL